MNFAIVGTGALGGFYGGLLARIGAEVHFLMRSDAEFVKVHGLRVDTKLGDFYLPKVNVYTDVREMPKCDCVIVALKSTQNHLLASLIPPLMHDRSVALVLQNGLHVEQATREVVGPGRVAGGCCFLCSNKIGPGHIRHLDYGKILMGPYRGMDDSEPGPDEERLNALRDIFRQTGIECNVTDSLSLARWRKLMWNIPFNGLSVLLNSSTEAIMKHPHSRALAESIIREVRETAVACGHEIEQEFVQYMMEHTDEMVPYDSSMRLDFLAGRPIEVEAIYGNALRAAARKNVIAPITQAMYRQLHFLADHRKVPSKS
ncbi:MAG: putative 2-dehydropantoate 2-reductase [Planctomycetes bacterium]|nr:putative 2-dehydropantoate 2-reductase [Planctomycetota bacterium]